MTDKTHRLSDDYSVVETINGARIFATIPGTTKPDPYLSSITLDDNAMQTLIEWFVAENDLKPNELSDYQ